MTTPSQPLPSIVTDRYTIEKQIGAGGMATVYLALDTKHDREVALKVLRPELGAVLGADRFLSEIKITARLDHPHILTLIDSGAADGLLYYVLPFVRGESLRDLLNRETQLPVEDAIALTKQVGSALDYAHRHGVIHRDIKPENILIQEGEAILTDFGIALAVKEAGGSRLTETGLSLGTPQYMSPEQATGDRTLGPKSDQYSLAAVLYEMLTGEPPISGATSQSIIAKLLTEEPTHVRTVRKSVSETLDAAISKALSKSPADRFASIGDFLRALSASTDAVPTAGSASKSNKKLVIGVATAAVAAAAAFAAFTMKSDGAPKSAPVALRDRTQLKFSGSVIAPSMSSDGKQLAYFVRTCPTEKCTYAINVQDMGSTEGKKILDGISAGFGLEWSPDRRNLMMYGTMNNRFGAYLIPVIGGTPRFVSSSGASFVAGGDSLVVAPSSTDPNPDSTYTFKVTSLAGDAGSSFKLPTLGGRGLIGFSSIPGTDRFLVGLNLKGRGLWQIVDRKGNSTSHLVNACTCGGWAASDAVWLARAGSGDGEAIVRVAIDNLSGKFATKQDTIYNGRFTGFSISADGTQFIVDDGSYEFNSISGLLADIMAKKIDQASVIKSSSAFARAISPDGNRLLKRLSVPDGKGGSTSRLSVTPFDGSTETPIDADGNIVSMSWVDSVSVAIGTQVEKGTHLTVVDLRNGSHRNDYTVPDSIIYSVSPLRDGWTYVSPATGRLVIVQNGQKRETERLKWFQNIIGTASSFDGKNLMYWGWNNGSNDSIGYVLMPLDGGESKQVFTSFAESANGSWLADGTFLAHVWETPDAATLTKLTFPGVERIGTIPHIGRVFSVSADMKRATLGWRDARADAFMYRVVKQ
jgi:serine/threonine protein kinase